MKLRLSMILGMGLFVVTTSYGSEIVMKPTATKAVQAIYGVTISDITNLPAIKNSLVKLPFKPTARIVFDPGMPASYYQPAVEHLHSVSFIMGELADSYAIKRYSVTTYRQRVEDYVQLFKKKIDIWEIGNEINGEWLGKTSDTIKKIVAANTVVKHYGGNSAITLYYNEGCADYPHHEMFTWVKTNIPQSIKSSVDYVFVSYYPDDCPNTKPDWNSVFNQLSVIFPQAKLGFGEVGTTHHDKKSQLIDHIYSLKIDTPNYVGGYFWWYFRQDMVPATKHLWHQLSLGFIKENKRFS